MNRPDTKGHLLSHYMTHGPHSTPASVPLEIQSSRYRVILPKVKSNISQMIFNAITHEKTPLREFYFLQKCQMVYFVLLLLPNDWVVNLKIFTAFIVKLILTRTHSYTLYSVSHIKLTGNTINLGTINFTRGKSIIIIQYS